MLPAALSQGAGDTTTLSNFMYTPLAAVCILASHTPPRGTFTTCLVSAAAAIQPDPMSSTQLRHSKGQATRPAAADSAATSRPSASATHQLLWIPPPVLYLPLASVLNSRAAIVCPQPLLFGRCQLAAQRKRVLLRWR